MRLSKAPASSQSATCMGQALVAHAGWPTAQELRMQAGAHSITHALLLAEVGSCQGFLEFGCFVTETHVGLMAPSPGLAAAVTPVTVP